MEKFWMVVGLDASSAAKARHDSFEKAQAEAERLCKKERSTFIVLEATHVVALSAPPVSWTQLD